MTISTYTIEQVALAVGRSADWLVRNWRAEVAGGRLPAPLHGRGELVWSAPAVLARIFGTSKLNAREQAIAAAIVAAHDAAKAAPDPRDVLDADHWKSKLREAIEGA